MDRIKQTGFQLFCEDKLSLEGKRECLSFKIQNDIRIEWEQDSELRMVKNYIFIYYLFWWKKSLLTILDVQQPGRRIEQGEIGNPAI